MLITNPANSPAARKDQRMRFKEQVLARADLDGVPKAAQDFGIAESILDSWRENTRLALEVVNFLNPPEFGLVKQPSAKV